MSLAAPFAATPHKPSAWKKSRSDTQRGIIALPLALIGGIAVAFSLTLYSSFGHWRRQAEDQLRLDRCVGLTARELVRIQEQVLKLNQALAALKAAAVATTIADGSASARAAMQAVYWKQEALLGRWKWTQAQWLTPLRCGNESHAREWSTPLADHGWQRIPEHDALGPGLLTRTPGQADTFLAIFNGGQHASAHIQTHISAAGLSGSINAKWSDGN